MLFRSETNPTTEDYTTTATVNVETGTAVENATLAGGAELAVVTDGAIKDAIDKAIDKGLTIDVENNLDTISPTNVVMRFAPYLFILGAAIVLLVLMRRRKAHNDAE